MARKFTNKRKFSSKRRHEPTILARSFKGFREFAKSDRLKNRMTDAQIDQALRCVHLKASDLEDDERRISLNQFSQLLEYCAIQTREEYFGLLFGEFYKPGNSGAFGYMLLNSPDVQTALKNVQRYMNIFVSVRSVNFEVRSGVGILSWNFPYDFHPRGQYVDLSIAFVLERIRLGAGDDWMPLAVHLEHKGRSDMDEYHRLLGKNLSFEERENRIYIDAKALHAPMPNADTELFSVIEGFSKKVLEEREEEEGVSIKVRRAIVRALAQGHSTFDDVAAVAGMDPAKLRRDLEKLGMSYTDILNDTRLALADNYLRDSKLRITEIALLLGFSELSAFTRAAKRWFGMPPLAYRKQKCRVFEEMDGTV